MRVEELLQDPELGLIIYLTVPAVYAKVCLHVLNSGKHVIVFTGKEYGHEIEKD